MEDCDKPNCDGTTNDESFSNTDDGAMDHTVTVSKPGIILRVKHENNNDGEAADNNDIGEDKAEDESNLNNKAVSLPKQSWLLRLFESTMFDSSMAMTYLFNSKEPGVLEFIGNKLFNFSNSDVDFYLPQLINMYIMMHAVAEVIHPYLIARYNSNTKLLTLISRKQKVPSFLCNLASYLLELIEFT